MDNSELLEVLNGVLQRQSKLEKMLQFQNDRISQMLERQFTSDKVTHRIQGMLMRALGEDIYNQKEQALPRIKSEKTFAPNLLSNFNERPPSHDYAQNLQNNASSHRNSIESSKKFELNNHRGSQKSSMVRQFQMQNNVGSSRHSDQQNFELLSQRSEDKAPSIRDHSEFKEPQPQYQQLQREPTYNRDPSIHSGAGSRMQSSQHTNNVHQYMVNQTNNMNWQQQNSQHLINSGNLNKALSENSDGLNQLLNKTKLKSQQRIFRGRSRSPSVNNQSINDRSNESRKRINSIPKNLLHAKILMKVSPENVCFTQFRYQGNEIIPRFTGWYQLIMEKPINLHQKSYFEFRVLKSSNCNIFVGVTNWERIKVTSSYNSGKAVSINLNDCFVYVKSTVIRNQYTPIPNNSIIRTEVENNVISWWKHQTLLAKVTIPQQLLLQPLFPYIEMFNKDDRVELL